MTLKQKVMPALVLMIICVVISGLVIGVHTLTYEDLTGVMTDELKTGCEDIFPDGNFEMLLDKEGNPVTFKEGIISVIVDKENKSCVFEISADGYEKGGLHVLVGINAEGKSEGIYFLEITETKGLGTKVQNDSFLSGLIGISSSDEAQGAAVVTGATYSSKGMKDAVSLAFEVYEQNKEAIFGE